MRLPAFLREPFKHIELRSPCQASLFFAQGRSNSLLAVFPRCESDQPDRERPVQKPRTAQNIKERPAQSA
jgi:hypothetical protein